MRLHARVVNVLAAVLSVACAPAFAATTYVKAGRLLDVESGRVLTDQAMPGMTGVQLAAAIGEKWPALPIVLGTGYAELPPDARAGMPRLGKPFSRDSLRRAIIDATRPDNVVALSARTR